MKQANQCVSTCAVIPLLFVLSLLFSKWPMSALPPKSRHCGAGPRSEADQQSAAFFVLNALLHCLWSSLRRPKGGERLWQLPIRGNDSLFGKQWVVFHVVEMQLQSWLTMSAFEGKADIAQASSNVSL
jgi:hypothetical protein